MEIEPSLPLTADLIRRQFNLLSERYAEDKFTFAGPEFVAMARNKRDAVRITKRHASEAIAFIWPDKQPAKQPAKISAPIAEKPDEPADIAETEPAKEDKPAEDKPSKEPQPKDTSKDDKPKEDKPAAEDEGADSGGGPPAP